MRPVGWHRQEHPPTHSPRSTLPAVRPKVRAVHEIAFHIGSLTVHWYGILVAAGFMAGYWTAQRRGLRDGLSPVTNEIVRAVRATIERTPPELVADLMLHGIAMTGGGSLLRGLDRRVATETRFPVYVTEDPLRTVVRGCAEALEEAETLQKVQAAVASRRPPR